jgi:hypothetical protein
MNGVDRPGNHLVYVTPNRTTLVIDTTDGEDRIDDAAAPLRGLPNGRIELAIARNYAGVPDRRARSFTGSLPEKRSMRYTSRPQVDRSGIGRRLPSARLSRS